MFTGIVEQMGQVSDVAVFEGHHTFRLEGRDVAETEIGASIAVNGVCLTAVDVVGDVITVDVIPETLERTNLGALGPGAPVNLERPMAANGRFDGHIVQGHVDGTGEIESVVDGDEGTVMRVRPPRDLLPFIVEKGSITVDGVSLTVAGLTETSFDVALIPHTLEVTTLGLRKPGDVVNLEVDVLAKYVERLLEARK